MGWAFHSVVFSFLIVQTVWFFIWTYSLIFHIFLPLSTFDSILLCYFDYSPDSIFLYFVCYGFLYVIIYIFCVFILCSQSFSVFVIEWYPFLNFAWKFSLLPWCYSVLHLTIHHSFLELCLSLIILLSASVPICSYIFCIHIW